MSQILWVALTWLAGTAAILGSLMTLGSLMLLFAPSVPPRSRPAAQPSPAPLHWRHGLKLLAASAAIALSGLGILVVIPFPVLFRI